MNEGKISVRYSRALFETALEKKVLDRVYDDMILISEVCRMDEVKEILLSPIIVPSKKKKILAGIFEKNVDKVTFSLINLLIDNGREDYLPGIARVFRDETLKYRGITETNLITAVPVNDKVRKQITDLVAGVFKTKVELKEQLDAGIIGGFILRINDNYIDASVRNKLRKISKGLAPGAVNPD